jgi:hypothetical protein
VIWLGRQRGYLTDWSTQLWVRASGRRVGLDDCPWLDGPAGDTDRIGAECFRQLAGRHQLTVIDGPGTRGILPDMRLLDGPEFRCASVSGEVRRFYERTADYELDAWAQWCGAFKLFGWLLAVMFSRRLQQLNVPLSGLDTSRGLTNDVWHLSDRVSGALRHVVWVRQLADSGTTVYAGSYGPCRIPGWPGPCLKVTFPLPNGNAMVIMKPTTGGDGSITLISSGERFGDPGFYFTVVGGDGTRSARYVTTMRETIRVYEAGPDEARADHTLTIWGLVFLRIHYRARRMKPHVLAGTAGGGFASRK